MTPSRIWPLLAGKYAPEDVLARWEREFADEFPRVQPLLSETGTAAETWTCGHGREGCARLVHRYEEGPMAACGSDFDRCARVPVEARDLALWRLDERGVIGALRAAVRLDAEGTAPGRIAPPASWLGERLVGGVALRFYLARRADGALCAEVAAADGQADDGVPILLAYTVADFGVAERARARGVNLVELAVSAALLEGGAIDVDLDAVFHEHRRRFVGLDPSTVLSPRKRLIIDYDGGRVWFDGARVRDEWREGKPFRLLVALARHPGVMVNRRRLYAAIWEEGSDRRTHDQYAGLIRPLRTAIGPWSKALILSTAGNDDQGGWKLDLRPEEVELWSEPPAFQQPVQQRKRRK